MKDFFEQNYVGIIFVGVFLLLTIGMGIYSNMPKILNISTIQCSQTHFDLITFLLISLFAIVCIWAMITITKLHKKQ